MVIPYGRQGIDEDDIQAVVEVLRSDWLTTGPKIEVFETALKEKFGAKHCCAVSNGTAALHLIGLALGWEPNDIIITSPLSFLASANCILYAGGTPDFVDINALTYTIDPALLEEKVKAYRKDGKHVKAVVAVDYAGHPCDWAALRSIADKYDIQLINDNCHALGASFNGDVKYASKYADAVVQSFHPVKHITTGEGGAILTNDSGIDKKIKLLRNHGMTKAPELMEKDHGPWYYEMVELGYNYRITDIQCSLGISQLKKLDGFIAKRRDIAARYNKAFGSNENFIIPTVSENIEHAYHLYPLQVKFDKTDIDREGLFRKMEEKGILLQVHYIPIHLQPYYRKEYGFSEGDLPEAEQFYSKEISLPMYPSLSEDDVEMVVKSLLELIAS